MAFLLFLKVESVCKYWLHNCFVVLSMITPSVTITQLCNFTVGLYHAYTITFFLGQNEILLFDKYGQGKLCS